MSWFWLSLLSAFSLATSDALTKKYLNDLYPWEMGVVRVVSSIPFLLPLLILIKWPSFNIEFCVTLLELYPLEILALLLYMWALKVSDLSLCLPFLSFTPIFLILSGWMILGELPNIYGMIGVILVVLGGYLLYPLPKLLDSGNFLKKIKSEKGPWLMLVVAFIYAITSALGKRAIVYSSAVFFGCVYYLGLGMIFLPAYWRSSRIRHKILMFKGMLIGFFTALMIISHVLAISQTKAVYMISIKRLSPLFGVLYGGFFLKERQMGIRFLATSLMCLGAIIIYLWGMK